MNLQKITETFPSVAILGNGSSLGSLKDSDIDRLNALPQMRSNWWFQDNITKLKHHIEAYFVGLDEHGMVNKFRSSDRTTKIIFSRETSHAGRELYFNTPAVLKELGLEFRGIVPTSGVSMFYIASQCVPGEILIAGIDFYTKRNQNGNLKYFGHIDHADGPYKNQEKPHTFLEDVRYFIETLRKTKDIDRIQALGCCTANLLDLYKTHCRLTNDEIANKFINKKRTKL